ncbi:glycolipid anchored surface protein [Diaporthe sp. PMI_573]|nr:glycolipid anchored surface protein [Diaporthaceae sp. PMI_573]
MTGSIRPVTIDSRYFWTGGKRFLVKGIVYQDLRRNKVSRSDPLADDGIEDLRRDLEAFKELGLNTLHVFHIDPTKIHDAVMKLLEDAGIYVLVGLHRQDDTIGITQSRAAGTLLLHGRLHGSLPEHLGVLVANEVINDHASTAAASVIRAVTRDVKRYMALAREASEQRVLPVGYSAADVRMFTRSTFDYLTAGSRDESIDFYCFCNYSWAGRNSSMQISGYNQLVHLFSDTDIPVFFSEYGANTARPRVFHETTAIYSSEMTHVFSGGCVYQFYQGPNGYGIVELTQNPEGAMLLRKSSEFKTLKKRLLGCNEQPVTFEVRASDQAEVVTRPFPLP